MLKETNVIAHLVIRADYVEPIKEEPPKKEENKPQVVQVIV